MLGELSRASAGPPSPRRGGTATCPSGRRCLPAAVAGRRGRAAPAPEGSYAAYGGGWRTAVVDVLEPRRD